MQLTTTPYFMDTFLQNFISYFKKEIPQIPLRITSLAPKVLSTEKDLERVRPYLNSLKSAIDDPDITNIALTGTYGSGKSTIIKTFQSQYPHFEYLNISLASFKDVKDAQNDAHARAQNEDALERQLEISILQQIFYHVRPSEIPDSRFKRIVNITAGKIWGFAVGLILWVVSILILFKADYVNHLNPASWDGKKAFDWIAPWPFIIFFIGIGLFAKVVIRLFSNSKINKFTIKGELELGDSLDKSVFNQHLEEILYFFERTGYNVVIIEDLDRFESTEIFTKLREINILLNTSKPIGRDINFIYAIKDEIFTDKSERVKFFEYIIPVIPFINPSNAGEQLARLVTEANIENVLSKDFIEDVVTFIDDIDMRLLTNIFHEYLIYRQNLNDDLNQDELFAMIVYKNLFPEDFGELHKRSGNLFQFLNNKDKYVKALLQEIATKIRGLETKIEIIESEGITELEELRRIYVSEFFSQEPKATKVHIDGYELGIGELIKEDNFEKFAALDKIRYTYYVFQNNGYGHMYGMTNTESSVTFSEVEDSINPEFSYEERVDRILGKKEDRQNLHRAAIQELREKKAEIDSWNLKQVFEDVDISAYLDTFSENLLVRNLLVNGYINENYNDYISLFHGVNFTKEDNTYLRNVKSGMPVPAEYKLTRTENVYKRLAAKYFGREVTLNYDLLDYMAENYEACSGNYGAVITQLCSGKDSSAAFIDSYLEKRELHRALFVTSICKEWKGFWDDISQKRNYTKEKVDQYLLLILKHADLEDIAAFRQGSNIAGYIEKHEDFLLLAAGLDIDKVMDIFKALSLKLEAVVVPQDTTRALFDFVYTKNHYRINYNNVKVIAMDKGQAITEEGLRDSNYTVVSHSGCDALISYLDANIEVYAKSVLVKPGNTKESEDSIVRLLNEDAIDTPTKKTFLKQQEQNIVSISSIDDAGIREMVLNEQKMVVDWENVTSYFALMNEPQFDSVLVEYLNETTIYGLLKEHLIKDAVTRDAQFQIGFIRKLLQCNELEYGAYKELVQCSHYSWKSLKIEELESDKVSYLTARGTLGLTVENYTMLRDHFAAEALHIRLAEVHRSVFVSSLEKYNLEDSDVLALLRSTVLTREDKVKILDFIAEDIIINSTDIAKLACPIYAAVPHKALSFDVVQCLFSSSRSISERIRILNGELARLTNEQVQELVSSLGQPYKDVFRRQYKPTFEKTDYHEILFNHLQRKKMINNFIVDRKHSDKYRVLANY
jgi:hypothetical protein